MVERNGADGERPRLRIAGYVPGHAEPVAGSEPEPGAGGPRGEPVNLPNIADYWPDQPSRRRVTGAPPMPPGTGFDPPPEEPGRRGRPAVLVGLLAGAVAVGTLLLLRPRADEPPPETAAPPVASATVAPPSSAPESSAPSSAPASSAAASSAPASSAPARPPLTTGRFDLVTGVTELTVRTADLNGENFEVTTPKDSGLDVDTSFADGSLKVSARPDGSEKGSGRVDVLLSKDVVWRLRMTGGVEKASFDMGGGTVSDIDLIGGAQRIDIDLGDLDGTLPILMAGGVNKWRISTSREVPVEIAFTSGAGDVTVYGRQKGGVGEGLTIKAGDIDATPGLDIDAEAGLGSLEIGRD